MAEKKAILSRKDEKARWVGRGQRPVSAAEQKSRSHFSRQFLGAFRSSSQGFVGSSFNRPMYPTGWRYHKKEQMLATPSVCKRPAGAEGARTFPTTSPTSSRKGRFPLDTL